MAGQIIDRAAEVSLSDRYRWLAGGGSFPTALEAQIPVMPAIAVPLVHKVDFEIPKAHITELKALLPSVTHLLCVGWRATDEPFLELLRDHLPKRLAGMCVTRTTKSAEAIAERLNAAGIDVAMQAVGGGFTGLTRSRAVRQLIDP